MSDNQELEAFLAWLQTYDHSSRVATLADLSDGSALFVPLSLVDPDYFRQPTRPSSQPSDNWVLRFAALKRLFRLITQYFVDVLHQPTASLGVPDLQAIAKDHSLTDTLAICRLTIAIAVQSEKNKDVIERIQILREVDQHALMRAIEQVMQKFPQPTTDPGEISMTDDDHYYQIQSDRSRVLAEKETLEKVYDALIQEHRSLQSQFDDAVSEKDDFVSQLRDLRRDFDDLQNKKIDDMLREEIDRLRGDLQKSEDNLAMTEAELEKSTLLVAEMTKKSEELQSKADQAIKLKDQVDEYRHAAEKVQKIENVMEKYKKKLEESADLRRHVKALEEQNAALVDKNASLEEEYRKVSAFRPLMESYKTQITDLEVKASNRTKEIESLKYQLGQTQTRLAVSIQERAQDVEALELYQERVKELELAGPRRPQIVSKQLLEGPAPLEAELGDSEDSLEAPREEDFNLGGELDDALTGTTTTDLKLQVRSLKRDLEALRSNSDNASRSLVLENLLDDANRMKARYEADYLAAHRDKLVLQGALDEVRSGASYGDGPEAAMALRQRLNETVAQLDVLQTDHAELEVRFEKQSRDLTIAKSDLTLVNKDQLDILNSLRESVNEDKIALEQDVHRLRNQVLELKDKNKMQLEQVNGLLLEKVNLQSEGIGHRERMLAQERDFGELRASIAGKDLPEETKSRLLTMHEDNVQLKEQLQTSHEKLLRARQFIKDQDRLFKQEARSAPVGSSFEEAEESYQAKIKILEEEITRHKRAASEMLARYRREQELMLGAYHEVQVRLLRDQQHGHKRSTGGVVPPSSWLAQQRRNMGITTRR